MVFRPKRLRRLDSVLNPWLVDEIRRYGQFIGPQPPDRFLMFNSTVSPSDQLHKSPSQVPHNYVYQLCSDSDCCIDTFFDLFEWEFWQTELTEALPTTEGFCKKDLIKPSLTDCCMFIEKYRLVFVPGATAESSTFHLYVDRFSYANWTLDYLNDFTRSSFARVCDNHVAVEGVKEILWSQRRQNWIEAEKRSQVDLTQLVTLMEPRGSNCEGEVATSKQKSAAAQVYVRNVKVQTNPKITGWTNDQSTVVVDPNPPTPTKRKRKRLEINLDDRLRQQIYDHIELSD